MLETPPLSHVASDPSIGGTFLSLSTDTFATIIGFLDRPAIGRMAAVCHKFAERKATVMVEHPSLAARHNAAALQTTAPPQLQIMTPPQERDPSLPFDVPAAPPKLRRRNRDTERAHAIPSLLASLLGSEPTR